MHSNPVIYASYNHSQNHHHHHNNNVIVLRRDSYFHFYTFPTHTCIFQIKRFLKEGGQWGYKEVRTFISKSKIAHCFPTQLHTYLHIWWVLETSILSTINTK